MEIVPDAKDWTWVLDRPCPECGFDTGTVAGQDVAEMLRTSAGLWQDTLRRNDVRERRDPSTWSPLEYGAHVRDVCRLFDTRLKLMLTQEDPEFENWDQDATAIADRYGEQDPAFVAAEIDEAARTLAEHFDQVSGQRWQRTGRRTDGARFTVDSFARYFVHDVVHHLHDVGLRPPGSDPRDPATRSV